MNICKKFCLINSMLLAITVYAQNYQVIIENYTGRLVKQIDEKAKKNKITKQNIGNISSRN